MNPKLALVAVVAVLYAVLGAVCFALPAIVVFAGATYIGMTIPAQSVLLALTAGVGGCFGALIGVIHGHIFGLATNSSQRGL